MTTTINHKPVTNLSAAFYTDKGMDVRFNAYKTQAGSGPSAYLAAVGFSAKHVATIANEVRKLCKADPSLHVDDAILSQAPNIETGEHFICSYDLRKAVRKAVTGRAG